LKKKETNGNLEDGASMDDDKWIRWIWKAEERSSTLRGVAASYS